MMKRWAKKVMLRWATCVLSIGLLSSADCLGQISYVGFNPSGGRLSRGGDCGWVDGIMEQSNAQFYN